jgi:hypothetical protein
MMFNQITASKGLVSDCPTKNYLPKKKKKGSWPSLPSYRLIMEDYENSSFDAEFTNMGWGRKPSFPC